MVYYYYGLEIVKIELYIECMRKEKSFRIAAKQINKQVLVLVPKLIIVGEVIPPMTS